MAEMKAEDVQVDLRDLKEFKKKNFEDRLKFIEFWVEYIKSHADEDWSKGQADLIDGQHKVALRFQENYQKAIREGKIKNNVDKTI